MLAAALPAAAQEPVDVGSPVDELADLRSLAEAIDPLARSAESEAAWKAFLDAVTLRGDDVEAEAFALNRIGDARYYQQNTEGALASSLEAKRRLDEAGETEGEAMAESLANIATFYSVTGRRDLELAMQERSLAIRRGLYGDDPEAATKEGAKALGYGYLNYANALYEHGQFAEAADLVQPSIAGFLKGGLTDSTLFVAMSSGANMLVDAGRPAEALRMAERGVELATELLPEDHPFMGFAQATLAKVLLQSGRFEEAEGPARRSLDVMADKLGPRHRNTLTAMHNLGVISMQLGRYREAIDLIMWRYDLIKDEYPGEAVVTLVSASNGALEMGDDALAREYGAQALEKALAVPASDAKADRGLLVQALRLEESGDYSAAAALVDQAMARMAERGEPVPADIAIRRGLLAIRTGAPEQGWRQVSAGADALEKDMLEFADRFELGADLSSYYESIMQIAEAAIAADRPDDALRAFELASWGVNARSRQLVALRDNPDLAPDIAEKVDLLRRNRETLRRLHRERSALLARDEVAEAGARASEIADLTDAVERSGAELGDAIADFGRWLRPATPDVATIQRDLGDDEALLVVMPARHRTLGLAITADAVATFESAGGRPRVRALVERLRAALVPGATQDFPVDAAAELHGIAIPPRIADLLEGRQNVALVTSDALSRLPFGVLLPTVPTVEQTDMRDMDWLAKHHAFSVALTPSHAFASHGGDARLSGFLGVGAPALAGSSDAAIDPSALLRSAAISVDDIRSLPALPATATEIEEVARALGEDAVTLLGAAATERGVRDQTGRARAVVLFATHGLLSGEIGGLREPALVLTPPDTVVDGLDDGLLQASEIAGLGLQAEFVILSACNSAAGRNMTAPAYTGLANAFLGSGTRGLMLSHWRVRDDAAAYLSTRTVRGAVDGLTRAAALRQAQIDLMNSDLPGAAHPAVWAPFVLIES